MFLSEGAKLSLSIHCVWHYMCRHFSSPIQTQNFFFGGEELLDRSYKIASTYNGIHNEFMNIKNMLIKMDTPKHTLIMNYLNKKHATSINSFTKKPPMTTTISMRLPYLGKIFYEVRLELQRFVHRYAITPFQLCFIHESNKLKKSFTCKDKQNHLRRSNIVYKLTPTCGSNYIGQARRNLITRLIEHKLVNVLRFAHICWPIPRTVLTSSNRKY